MEESAQETPGCWTRWKLGAKALARQERAVAKVVYFLTHQKYADTLAAWEKERRWLAKSEARFASFRPNEIRAQVNIGFLRGSRAADARAANHLVGFARTPRRYQWHHSERLGVMQLVSAQMVRTGAPSDAVSLIVVDAAGVRVSRPGVQ